MSSHVLSASMCTDTIPAIDPELTPAEDKQLDRMVEADIEFWKEERNGTTDDPSIRTFTQMPLL